MRSSIAASAGGGQGERYKYFIREGLEKLEVRGRYTHYPATYNNENRGALCVRPDLLTTDGLAFALDCAAAGLTAPAEGVLLQTDAGFEAGCHRGLNGIEPSAILATPTAVVKTASSKIMPFGRLATVKPHPMRPSSGTKSITPKWSMA